MRGLRGALLLRAGVAANVFACGAAFGHGRSASEAAGSTLPVDCRAVALRHPGGHPPNGIHTIHPPKQKKVEVYCDFDVLDGSGWALIAKRSNSGAQSLSDDGPVEDADEAVAMPDEDWQALVGATKAGGWDMSLVALNSGGCAKCEGAGKGVAAWRVPSVHRLMDANCKALDTSLSNRNLSHAGNCGDNQDAGCAFLGSEVGGNNWASDMCNSSFGLQACSNAVLGDSCSNVKHMTYYGALGEGVCPSAAYYSGSASDAVDFSTCAKRCSSEAKCQFFAFEKGAQCMLYDGACWPVASKKGDKAATFKKDFPFTALGEGFCNEGYLGGKKTDAEDLITCAHTCQSEKRCKFFTFIEGETCSRYGIDAGKCSPLNAPPEGTRPQTFRKDFDGEQVVVKNLPANLQTRAVSVASGGAYKHVALYVQLKLRPRKCISIPAKNFSQFHRDQQPRVCN